MLSRYFPMEMKMLKYASLAVLLAAAAPVVAQTAPPAQAQPGAAPASKVDPLNKMICKTEEVIGSRLNTQRVCMTAREWKDQADDTRQAIERMQQGQGNVPSG
jgi:invasion protein IalB